MEYKEGEALDIAGFVLRSVSPARVVIENRGTGATLNIPMQD
jgi:type II secretory pathway component PulC